MSGLTTVFGISTLRDEWSQAEGMRIAFGAGVENNDIMASVRADNESRCYPLDPSDAVQKRAAPISPVPRQPKRRQSIPHLSKD